MFELFTEWEEHGNEVSIVGVSPVHDKYIRMEHKSGYCCQYKNPLEIITSNFFKSIPSTLKNVYDQRFC